jgi:hypothetical protein
VPDDAEEPGGAARRIDLERERLHSGMLRIVAGDQRRDVDQRGRAARRTVSTRAHD